MLKYFTYINRQGEQNLRWHNSRSVGLRGVRLRACRVNNFWIFIKFNLMTPRSVSQLCDGHHTALVNFGFLKNISKIFLIKPINAQAVYLDRSK